MTTNEPTLLHEEEANFNFKRYLFKIIINWPLFIISLVLSFTIGYLIVRYTEPLYKVSARIIINDEINNLQSIYPFLNQNFTQRNLQNEILTLKSYSLTQKTIEELEFDVSYVLVGRIKETKIYNPFFKVIPDTTLKNINYVPIYVTLLNENEILVEIEDINKIKRVIRFGEKFESQNYNFTLIRVNHEPINEVIIKNRVKFYFFFNDLHQLVRIFQDKLTITLDDKKGSVLSLSTVGPIPQKEVDYLNKLTEVYISNSLDEKNRISENVIKFIDEQLAQISDSLTKVEKRLQDFRNENNIFDIKIEENYSINKLNELQNKKFSDELKLRYCRYIRDYIENKQDVLDLVPPSTFDINDVNLLNVLNEWIALNREKTFLKYIKTEQNPTIQLINAKIENTKKAVLEKLIEFENSLKYSIQITNDNIAKEEQKLFNLPPIERKLLTIEREYEINNNIFSFLLQKRAEAGITKASNTVNKKVLDPARIENAILIKPNRSKIYTNALILGLAIPLIIILLIEYLNNKLTDFKTLSRLKKSNFIGAVGHNNKDSEIPVFEFPRSAFAESFRGLRSNLTYVFREKGEKVVLITSTISGEGKTFCAVNLASIIAMSDRKVLIGSFDLRKPKVHRYFNLPNSNGISNYLIGNSDIDDIILPTNIKNLYLLPSGPVPPNPAELLETKRMKQLINEVRQRFDYIILDSPPIAIVSDAIIISQFADATLYIARYNYSSKDVLDLAEELADRQQLKRIFVLVNDVKAPGYYGYSSYYAASYRYSYHYTYGYNYYAYGSDYYIDDEKPRKFKDKIKAFLGM